MSCNLNSLKGDYISDDAIGEYFRPYEGGYEEFRLQLIGSTGWVAVKELKLSSYIKETPLSTEYPHYGHLV